MPYIAKEGRHNFDYIVDEFKGFPISSPGDLNYLITRLCMNYIGKMSYTKANEVIGVLECVKLELYRRALTPYEDVKIVENGDVIEYEEK